MVGVGKSKFPILEDGVGWTIGSNDESVATIKDDPLTTPSSSSHDFILTGVGKGVTHVLGEPPGGLPPLRLLQVEVKEELRLKIAFQFVTDNSINSPLQWNQTTGFMSQLKNNTNNIFEQQANMIFDVLREKDVQVSTSLRDIIGKQNRADLAFTRSLRGPYREWEKLTAEGDSRASINVFFIARSILRKENTLSPLIFGMDGNILVEDDPFRRIEKLERELAQLIAEMLGVQRTRGLSHPEHLMSQSSDITARKLPKEHANILNPTF